EGFSGSVTDAYIQHGTTHDKAFECDGYNTDFSNEGGYYANPTITNVTVFGANDGSEAVRLRAGTQGTFTNIVLNNFGKGFRLDGDAGDNPTGQGVLDDLLNVVDVTFNNVTTTMENNTGAVFNESDFITGVGNGTGTDYATWTAGWTVGIN
ncbi:MAG: multidrug transporter, partial [Bacteroidota bacterium]|nr:multidrug transporter [Bacteroidota bacterium]